MALNKIAFWFIIGNLQILHLVHNNYLNQLLIFR